jgi:hypothetical protein
MANPLKLNNDFKNNFFNNFTSNNNDILSTLNTAKMDTIDIYNDVSDQVKNIDENMKAKINIDTKVLKNEEYQDIKTTEPISQHFEADVHNFASSEKYSNDMKYQNLNKKITLLNSQFIKIDRLTFYVLKPIVKKYYLSQFIPNEYDYKYIFQKIHDDILHKKIFGSFIYYIILYFINDQVD